MDFGLLLWAEDNSGLPTGPLIITKTLKHFFVNVLLEHVGLIRVLPLPVHVVFFPAQVKGTLLLLVSAPGPLGLRTYWDLVGVWVGVWGQGLTIIIPNYIYPGLADSPQQLGPGDLAPCAGDQC